MTLKPDTLARSLVADWLPGDDGPWSGDVGASADALAGAVAAWFAQAQAAGVACATAQARRAGLASQLTAALGAGDAAAAGQQVATAFAAYVTGQAFGPGVAGSPLATTAGGTAIGAALRDRAGSQSSRADAIAAAHQMIAASSTVAFPGPPPFVAPIM